MKKSVISFIAVLLVIVFLGVTAVTGVYIPGGWTMPFRDSAVSDTADTGEDTSTYGAATTDETTPDDAATDDTASTDEATTDDAATTDD